jgi:6-pyruvoyltetrahydropterin/6-carboxytetrahydropterin synthase
MTARYTMKVVTDFAAAHYLRGYDGPCNRLHGHNWKIEVEATASKLDEVGMGIDFKDLKGHTKVLLDKLDHYNLNDIPPFDEINPTAENLSCYIYTELSKSVNDGRVRISCVTIWETERACVRYEEE